MFLVTIQILKSVLIWSVSKSKLKTQNWLHVPNNIGELVQIQWIIWTIFETGSNIETSDQNFYFEFFIWYTQVDTYQNTLNLSIPYWVVPYR